MRRAASRAACTAGKRSPIKIPIIAMTTRSSTRVKPERKLLRKSLFAFIPVISIKNGKSVSRKRIRSRSRATSHGCGGGKRTKLKKRLQIRQNLQNNSLSNYSIKIKTKNKIHHNCKEKNGSSSCLELQTVKLATMVARRWDLSSQKKRSRLDYQDGATTVGAIRRQTCLDTRLPR